jgi:hypothetical protein
MSEPKYYRQKVLLDAIEVFNDAVKKLDRIISDEPLGDEDEGVLLWAQKCCHYAAEELFKSSAHWEEMDGK